MTETYTDWSLVSLSPLSSGWTIALVVAVLVACALVLWSYRGAKRRWLLASMRLLAAALVLGFLVEPALQLRLVRKIRNRLAIVVDRSRSMSLGTAGGHSRWDNVQALLHRSTNNLARLGRSHIIEWYDLKGPIASGISSKPPTGEHTDLLAGLEHAREAGRGKPLAGVVLFSDGADNASLEGARHGTLSQKAIERLKDLGAPVNVVDAAGKEQFKDVAVTNVVSDQFAFVHNTFEVDAMIDARGYGKLTVPVTLEREGQVIATREAVVSGDKPTRVALKSKPDKIGEFVYSVSVPSFAGEAIANNNKRSFVVRVIRDKIRVLQVAGRPSWDERFLRQHLKENPNVDLISFFILRTPTDDASVPEKELSLIPFPVDKIFRTQLHTFDVVILQDFDYRPYHMEQYLATIRDAVKGGLGLVMVGGPQSFADGGYQGTALQDILPLRLDTGGMLYGSFHPTLTEAGRSHPVTNLSQGGSPNVTIWNQLPAWTSVNRTGCLAPSATALAVDPTSRCADGKPLPLIAVMDVDHGRSMAIATDSMWRWRFSSHRDGGLAERAYHRFWSNALRWLVRDPEHSRVRVLPEKERFDNDEPVDVSFVVLGKDYQPVPYAHLRVTLSQTGASTVHVDDLTAGENGNVRKRYTSLAGGAYRITATASASGTNLGQGQAVFVIQSRSAELSHGAPRPDLLRKIADVTGGKVLNATPDLWNQLSVINPDVVEVDRRRNVELWDNGWALAVGILLLAAEWAIRRRRGYL